MREKRKPSKTRVIGYKIDGVKDPDCAEHILDRALRENVVTQFDSGASDEGTLFWFNGPPSAALRRVRDAIEALVW